MILHIFLMYFISIITVAMMEQSCTLFFIVTGLSDAYLRTSTWDGNSGKKNTQITDTRRFRFQKVL